MRASRSKAPKEAAKELAVGDRVEANYENMVWLAGKIMQILPPNEHSTTTKSEYQVKHDDRELIWYWTGSIRHKLSKGSHGTPLEKRPVPSTREPSPSPKKPKTAFKPSKLEKVPTVVEEQEEEEEEDNNEGKDDDNDDGKDDDQHDDNYDEDDKSEEKDGDAVVSREGKKLAIIGVTQDSKKQPRYNTKAAEGRYLVMQPKDIYAHPPFTSDAASNSTNISKNRISGKFKKEQLLAEKGQASVEGCYSKDSPMYELLHPDGYNAIIRSQVGTRTKYYNSRHIEGNLAGCFRNGHVLKSDGKPETFCEHQIDEKKTNSVTVNIGWWVYGDGTFVEEGDDEGKATELGYKMGFVLCDHGVNESSGMTVHPYCWVKGDAQGPCVMPTTQYKWDIKNFWVRDTTAEEDAILDAKMIVRRDECIAVQREIAINAAETSAIYQKKKADKLVCDGTCQFSLKAQKDLKDYAADLRKANQTIQGFQSQATKKSKIDDVATKNVEKVLGESKELKDQNKLHLQDIKQKNKELLDLRVVLEKLQNESVFLQGQVQILQQQQQQPQYMQHQQQQQPSLQHMQQMQQMQMQQMQQMQMFPARRPVQQQLELISPTVTMNDIPTYSLQPQNIGFLPPQQGVAPQFTTMYHR